MVKMDDPKITMKEYIRLEEEKAHRRGKVYNWETATYGKIWDNKDVHDLGSVETEFPTIVFNDTLTSEIALSCESMDNDDDKVDIKHSSRDLSVKLLPDVINTDVGAYAHGSNKLLETSHDTSNKFFKKETSIKGLNFNIWDLESS
ncbi:hypothetical protein Tco_1424537 [Tanacetum coccineum]